MSEKESDIVTVVVDGGVEEKNIVIEIGEKIHTRIVSVVTTLPYTRVVTAIYTNVVTITSTGVGTEGINPHDLIKDILSTEDYIEEVIKMIDATNFLKAMFLSEKEELLRLRRKLMEKREEIWDTYVRENKKVPYNVAEEVLRLVENARKYAEKVEELVSRYLKDIVIDITSDRFDVALLKLGLRQLMEKMEFYKALVPSIARYLKRRSYEVLMEYLEKAEAELYSLQRYLMEGRIDRAQQSFFRAFMYLGFVQDVVAYIVGRLEGIDMKKVYEKGAFGDKELRILFLLGGDINYIEEKVRKYEEVRTVCLAQSLAEKYVDWKEVDKCLRKHGLYGYETMELLARLVRNYKRIKNGEEPEVDPLATARWTLDDLTDWLFFLDTWSSSNANELFEQAKKSNDPTMSIIYRALGYSVLVGAAVGTGLLLLLLDTVTGGLATPVIATIALARFANEISYYFTDPLVKEEMDAFLEAVKNNDPEAIELLSQFILMSVAGAIGYSAGAKVLGRIKIYNKSLGVHMSADEYIGFKIRDLLLRLSLKAKKRGFDRLAEVFRKFADRYATKLVTKLGGRMEPDELVITGFDDGGNFVVLILEKGRIEGGGFKKITIDKNVFKMLKEISGLSGDDIKYAYKRLAEGFVKVDSAKMREALFNILDDVGRYFIEAYRKGIISSDELANILKNMSKAKNIAVRMVEDVAGKGAYQKVMSYRIGVAGDKMLTIIKVDGEGNIRAFNFLVRNRNGIPEIVVPKEIKKIDLFDVFGTDKPEDIFTFIYRTLEEGAEPPFMVLSHESAHMVWDRYARKVLITSKGSIDLTAGVPRIRVGDELIEMNKALFRRVSVVTKDGRYMKYGILQLDIASNPNLAKILYIGEKNNIVRLLSNAFRALLKGEKVDDVVRMLKNGLEDILCR